MNNNQFQSNTFDSTFKKFSKLIKEHLNVQEQNTQDNADTGTHYATEPRDAHGRVDVPDQIAYDVKTAKGQVSKIIAKLSSNYSGGFTRAIEKFKEIQKLLAAVEALEKEFKQEGVREKIAALFGAEYEYATRVIKLVSAYEIVLSAQPKAAETVKWKEVYEELSEKLTPELKAVGETIVKKYTTAQAPKPPSLKVNEPEEEVTEGISDLFKSFLNKLKSWGGGFDRKLNAIRSKVESL